MNLFPERAMLRGIACVLGGHERDRRKVWHDDQAWRGKCKGYEKAMVRDGSEWRPRTSADRNADGVT